MGGLYEDAKDLALRQWPILADLFRSYLKLNGNRFLMLSETPTATRLLSTLWLIVIYLTLLAAFVLLNPLTENISVLALGRSGAQFILLFLISCLPLYLVMRPGTGIPALHFFLNLQLVAASVAIAIMCPVIVTGLLLSQNLQADLHEVAQGRGRNTAIFVTHCGNLEARRDLLLMQTELNAMTGEFDHPFFNGSIFDSEAEKTKQSRDLIRYLWARQDRERNLPEQKRQRVLELRQAIPAKVMQTIPQLEPALSEYPAFIYTLVGAQIMIPITSVLGYIMIWQVFSASRRSRAGKAIMAGRLLLAVIASVSFSFWFYNSISNRTIQTRMGIAESRRFLHEEAQNFAWCRLDPKGLW